MQVKFGFIESRKEVINGECFVKVLLFQHNIIWEVKDGERG